MNRICFFAVGLVVLCVAFFGCGGKKAGVSNGDGRTSGSGNTTAAQGSDGKPTWLKLDRSKFGKLSDYETNLEGGTITVYDPEGWERLPAQRGFVIAFRKDGATIRMTKSKDVEDMPDIDRDNIEEFADDVQQSFKAPTQMLELGNLVGVMFAKQVADRSRINRKLNCRVFATAINGRLFTYELISEKITDAQLGVLYAVISTTRIGGGGASVATMALPPEPQAELESTVPTEPVDTVALSAEPVEPANTKELGVDDAGAAEPSSEPAQPVVAAVAPAPVPEVKPEPPKPAPVRDRRSTRAVLKELEEALKETDGG